MKVEKGKKKCNKDRQTELLSAAEVGHTSESGPLSIPGHWNVTNS